MQPADAFLIAYSAAKRAVKPKESLTVSQWSDTHRVLSQEGSAEPGQWRTSRNPPMREIMDALSEHSPVTKVAFMKPSQWGGTEIGSNFVGYVVDHARGPMAVVMPTERSLNDWVSQKFDPMAKDTPAVAESLAKKSNKSSDNNAQRKKFTGGILYFKTAGSTAELKSTSLRYALGDEIDEWGWSTEQGSPIRLLEIRVTAFYDSKLYLVSSPTMKDASNIEEEFENGDKRRFHVPCPHCGELQVLNWTNLKWDKAVDNPKKVTRVYYACAHHGCVIEEHDKTQMLAGGKWIAEAPDAHYRSYHINGLYTPIGLGKNWMQLVYEWIAAQDDPKDLMVFVNTRLAETFADRSHDVKPNVLKARAEPYSLRTIPQGCLILTAGVDVQDDRLEIQVTGFGMNDKTWPIDYHVLTGNPADNGVWNALTNYLKAATFTNQFGKKLRLEATAIDTGGHHTHKVYQYVRDAGRNGLIRVMACKGASTYGRKILGRPSMQDVNWRNQTIKKGVALYLIGADTAKHLLYNRLNSDADKDASARKVHFSQDLDDSYFEGMVAETYNPRKNRWELKKGKRNEQLDTWILSVAASMHPEIYVDRWKKSDWERRQMMIEPEERPADEKNAAEDEPPKPTTTRKKRRVVRRS